MSTRIYPKNLLINEPTANNWSTIFIRVKSRVILRQYLTFLTIVNACVRELAPRPMVKLFSLIEQIEILMYKLINFSKQAFFSEPTSICFPKSYMGQNTQISFSYSHKDEIFSYSFENRKNVSFVDIGIYSFLKL